MIILTIHDIRIAILKLEGHSPVAADPDSVPPFTLSLQGVKAPARQIHIRNVLSGVQGGQLVAQLVLVVGMDAPASGVRIFERQRALQERLNRTRLLITPATYLLP